MNYKSVFHSSVILTKVFGCFWDTFGGVRGPPGTQLGGENPHIATIGHFTPYLSAFPIVLAFSSYSPSNPSHSII